MSTNRIESSMSCFFSCLKDGSLVEKIRIDSWLRGLYPDRESCVVINLIVLGALR